MRKKDTILIVNNNKIDCSILYGVLKDYYNVLHAVDGKHALQIIKDSKITTSVIILDLKISVEDVCGFLKSLKSNSDFSTIPIIIITEDSTQDIEMKAWKLGVISSFKKPYNSLEIRKCVSNILTLSKAITKKTVVERDSLTGIYNRDTFCRETERMLEENKCRRYILVCCDIERFKVINNLFGTKVGDNVLKGIAKGLKNNISRIGTFGRLEADHFAICLPYSKFDAEKLISDMDKSIQNHNLSCNVVSYFGIYPIDDITIPVSQMCDRAGLALRSIKGNYIKRYAYYNSAFMDTIMKEQEIINEMNGALEQGQFCIYLQPIYSISKKRLVSAEALVRWNHPVKGLISPDLFIPLFERNGFIEKLDAFVREEVCKYIRKLEDKYSDKELSPISVNISRMNFYNSNFCSDVINLIEKYKINPKFLKLEITESAYMDNPKQLLGAMRKLQNYGLKIMMDDFGSGYSSLNMLKDVPVDVLKIDMQFINDVGISGRAGNVMTSVVRMAKWLDMVVIAEGVETKNQLNFLKSIGCDTAQGYYFSKPLPINKFDELFQYTQFEEIENDEVLDHFNMDVLCDLGEEGGFLYNHMIGAMGFCEIYNKSIEIVRVNECYYELAGLTPETLYKKSKYIIEDIHIDDRKMLFNKFYKAKEQGNIEKVLVRHYHQDGHLMWIDMKIRYMGKKGSHYLYQFALSDITQQKIYEENKQRDKYIDALRYIFDSIYEINFTEDTYISVHSKGTCDAIFTPFKLLHRTIGLVRDNLVYPDDRCLYDNIWNLEHLKRELSVFNKCYATVEIRIKDKNGEYMWKSVTLIVLENNNNEDKFLCCISDINNKKLAQIASENNRIKQLVNQNQEYFKRTIKHTSVVVFEWDFENGECWGGEGYKQYEISKKSVKEIMLNTKELDIVHPADASLLSKFFEDAKNGLRYGDVILRIKKINRKYIWCRLMGDFIKNKNGELVKVIGTINNIDLYKESETNLNKTNEELGNILINY